MTVLLTMGGLGYNLYLINDAFTHTRSIMMKSGWGKILHSDEAFFLQSCLWEPLCSSKMATGIMHFYNYWWLTIPLMLLPFVLFFKHKAKFNPIYKPAGSAEWAKAEELKKNHMLGKFNAEKTISTKKNPIPLTRRTQVGYFGVYQDGSIVQLRAENRCEHVMVEGGTGAGKSTKFFKQNLLLDALQGCGAIVFDLKYPDIDSGFKDAILPFHKMGRRIQVFTPFDKYSLRLNLLAGCDTYQSAVDLAEIFKPKPEKESGADFYRSLERSLISVLLYAVGNEEEPSLRRIYRILMGGVQGVTKYIQDHPDFDVRTQASGVLKMDPKTLQGLIANLQGEFRVFDDPYLARATSAKEGETLDLEDVFRNGGLIYIGIQEDRLGGLKGQALLQMIKRMIDNTINKVAQENGGRCPTHTSIYIDEFPSFGRIPDIARNLRTMRSRNICYQLSFQNRADGYEVYGRDSFNAMYRSNLGTKVIFPFSLDTDEALKQVSVSMGDMLVHQVSEGTSQSISWMEQDRKISGNVKESSTPLMTPNELRTFPKTQALVLARGINPVRVHMPFLSEAKIDGISNPLHEIYTKLYAGMDRYFDDETHKRKLEELCNNLIRNNSVKTSEVELDRELEAQVNPAQFFLKWIREVLEDGCQLTFAKQANQGIVKIMLNAETIAAKHQEMIPLQLHEKHQYLVLEAYDMQEKVGTIRVTREGCKVLSKELVDRVESMRFVADVLIWIRKNSQYIKNHPVRMELEKAGKVELPRVEAILQEDGNLLITKEVFFGIYNSKSIPLEVKQVSNRKFYVLPLSDLAQMEQATREIKESRLTSTDAPVPTQVGHPGMNLREGIPSELGENKPPVKSSRARVPGKKTQGLIPQLEPAQGEEDETFTFQEPRVPVQAESVGSVKPKATVSQGNPASRAGLKAPAGPAVTVESQDQDDLPGANWEM